MRPSPVTRTSTETPPANDAVLTEEEQQVVFNHRVLGNSLTLEAYREEQKSKKDAAGKTA